MYVIAAQLTPQRSTQYSELVNKLAPHEIVLSSVGGHLEDTITTIQLGSQQYLVLRLNAKPDGSLLQSLDSLAMTSAYFEYFDRIGDVEGPLLRPVEIPSLQVYPKSLVATRRYRGKTNEVFTQFMCNLARFSSDYRSTPWNTLTLLDPLAGGGTTLFVGLMYGADVAGVELNSKVVEGTVGFLKEYVKQSRISATFRVDKIKSAGKRWFVTLGETTRCSIGMGDTSDVQHFVHGLKRPQLIVTDLPYGIQHRAEWKAMLVSALPAWERVLAKGGALVYSWDATRFSRSEMIELVHQVSNFVVLDDAPYNSLAHRVDRVIKKRDVIVARREGD